MAIAVLSVVAPAGAAAPFSFAVFGRGNPAVKVEVSAEGFRQTREVDANGRVSFEIPGSPKVVYFWIEGCGAKRGGQYAVNGTVAARLDIDKSCGWKIASNQDNLR